MALLTHADPEVRKHALLCTQKLLVANWQFIGREGGGVTDDDDVRVGGAVEAVEAVEAFATFTNFMHTIRVHTKRNTQLAPGDLHLVVENSFIHVETPSRKKRFSR